MSFLNIDTTKCLRDGLCALACPGMLITLPHADAFPQPIPEAEDLCIQCGHCVAICPPGALSLSCMRPENCPPVDTSLRITPEQAEQFLRGRRSIRNFKKDSVPRELIKRLIKLASYAPTASNKQTVRWLVLETTDQVRAMVELAIDWLKIMLEKAPEMAGERRFDRIIDHWSKGNDRICRGAPHVIVTHAPKDDMWAQVDADIALTYFELGAWSLGVGACWGGYFKSASIFYPPMSEALELPPGHHVTGAMMIGWPKLTYQRLPLRNEPVIMWR
jgi:nitroreductase/NAD-dependent dihydropyrimidine dehydrogenase PreA subunit